MNKRLSILSTVVLCLVVCAVTYVSTASSVHNDYKEKLNSAYDYYAEFNKIKEIDDIVRQSFVGDYDFDDLAEGMLQGYLEKLGDPYSMYHSIDEMTAISDSSQGKLYGIGVRVAYDIDTEHIYITHVMESSPAEAAGLLPGDRITSVDGTGVKSETYTECINLVKGDINTEVALEVDRGEEKLDIKVTRGEVTTQSVYMDYVGDNIAFIQIVEFEGNTYANFKSCMETAKNNNVNGYIFDVRGNPGGDLTVICNVLESIMPKGPIVKIRNSKNEIVETKESKTDTKLDAPVVVLTNGNTASAAELFTAVLRDYDMAKIVGTNTFGKGTMQQIYKLSDGSGLRLTVNYYDPPYSANYNGKGIAPDVESELDEEYSLRSYLLNVEKENDTQLADAIEEINKIIKGESN